MFTTTLNCLVTALPVMLRLGAPRKSERHGPLPTWSNDPQLSEQLLRDTGLTVEDLGVHKARDEKKSFFQQQNYW